MSQSSTVVADIAGSIGKVNNEAGEMPNNSALVMNTDELSKLAEHLNIAVGRFQVLGYYLNLKPCATCFI